MSRLRNEILTRVINSSGLYDIAVIGGGATGLGAAVDAASRGHSVALFERGDFASETSSRSTKLLHGGVRYLKHGHVSLVREALHERACVRRMAPHLTRKICVTVPAFSHSERLFFHVGLKLYDLLAGRSEFPRAKLLSKQKLLGDIPTLHRDRFIGGLRFSDGQFDDARLAVALARTALRDGADVLNYTSVEAIGKGAVKELRLRDSLSGESFSVRAKVVVNATGIFSDEIRRLENPSAAPALRFSRGTHIVLDPSFLGTRGGLLIPKTADGRVLFVLPWYDKVIAGTTEFELPGPISNVMASNLEIDFLLKSLSPYLAAAPTRNDVRAVVAGIRPLVTNEGDTSTLSREDRIEVSPDGLISVLGGKWTTFRAMAERVVNNAEEQGKLTRRPCQTKTLSLVGSSGAEWDGISTPYGSEQRELDTLEQTQPELSEKLHPDRPYRKSQVIWAVRSELAQTVSDVLSRRIRALSCDTKSAIEMAPEVARLIALELGHSTEWQQSQVEMFRELAIRSMSGE